MKRNAIKADLFAGDKRRTKLDKLGDPLALLDRHIDFAELAAQAIFEGVQQQLDAHGYLARCGQIVDATIVPAPRQHFTREEKALMEQDAMPVDWTPAKRCQKDLDARLTKKHGQSHHGYRLTVNVDVRHKFIRKIQTSTASEHDSRHLESVLDRANTSADVYAENRRDSAIKFTSGRTSSLCHDVRKAIGEGGCGMSGLFEVPFCCGGIWKQRHWIPAFAGMTS